MFTKLLKYEWKSTGKILGILSLGALGTGALAGVVLWIMSYYDELIGPSQAMRGMALAGLGILLFFLILALAIYGAGVSIFLLIRFHKNKFTDQGYLTFTLPVSSRQIFLSSAAYILIWQILSGLVVLLAAALMVIIGILPYETPNMGPVDLGGILATDGVTGYVILNVLKMVAAWLSSTVLMMTSVTLGAVWAKRHKLLAAIGIYYGITMVANTVTSIVSFFVLWHESARNAGAGLELLIHLGVLMGGYFLSTHMMEKKLNLP